MLQYQDLIHSSFGRENNEFLGRIKTTEYKDVSNEQNIGSINLAFGDVHLVRLYHQPARRSDLIYYGFGYIFSGQREKCTRRNE